jgi:DNA-binding SARP family transcriptional activator/TolB-like protein/Flp pilus assembly protein TadD
MPNRDGRPELARVQLLGEFALEAADGSSVSISSRRARALMAYLYLSHGHGARREQLCALLWGDRGEIQARNSLRQSLLSLRHQLISSDLDLLQIGRDRIVLRAAGVASDIGDLRQSLDDGDPSALVAALAHLGRRRMLEDLEIPGLYEAWLFQTRSELDQSLATRIHARLKSLEVAGRWAEVRAVAEAYISRDPLDEVVVAAAIRADVASGSHVAAHRRFQALRSALAKELAVAPGPAVRDAIATAAVAPVGTTPGVVVREQPSIDHGQGSGPSDQANLERWRPGTLGGGRPTVAVLSFENLAGAADHTYLSDGIAEDIAGALTRFKWLFVLSPRSSLNYGRPDATLRQIRNELGVRYVVHGKLILDGTAISLAVSLSDCMLEDTIWSRRFQGRRADVFAIESETIATIVGTLEPALIRREEESIASSEPRTLEHWDLFIRGRWHFWQLSYRNVESAQALLARALSLRPDDSQTLSLLAFTYTVQLWSGWTRDPEGALASVRKFAMRAVRTGPEDAFARYTLGCALTLTGDLERAMAEQLRALEINPNLAGAMGELGRYHAFSGEYDKATAYFDRAIRTSPNDAQMFLWLRHRSVAAFTAGRDDEAVASAKAAVASRPDVSFNHYLLAATLAARGDAAAARAAFAEARRLLPKYSSETMKFSNPFKFARDMQKYVDALKMCGWTG